MVWLAKKKRGSWGTREQKLSYGIVIIKIANEAYQK